MKTETLIIYNNQISKQYAILNKGQVLDLILGYEKVEILGTAFENYIYLDDDIVIEMYHSNAIDFQEQFKNRIEILKACNFEDITELLK